MGSLTRTVIRSRPSQLRFLGDMSWTWRGFWTDDPVFRFKSDESFFQSGRHKAEERFWVNHIHDDGSYRRPLRSRHYSATSSYYLEKSKEKSIKDKLINLRKESTQHLEETEKMNKEDENDRMKEEDINGIEDETEKTDYEKNKEETEKNTKKEMETKYIEDKEERMSTMTCLSCTKCSQPLGWVEKERYVSRMV